MIAAAHTYGDESWLDRFGKWAPLITLALVVSGGAWAGVIALEGGFQSGNQVEIKELKAQVADVKKDAGDIKKSLEPLPRALQIIDDHTKQIGNINDAHEKLRDRVGDDEAVLAATKAKVEALSQFRVPRN